MNKKVVLVVGAVLIAVGIFKPDLSNLIPGNNNAPVVDNPVVQVEEPSDPALKNLADEVVAILQKGGDERKVDGLNLAKLYNDIAMIISLDEDNAIVKTTSEIREVNSVAGSLMNLNLKGKYPNLPSTAKDLVVAAVGDDVAVLNDANREQAVAAFKALAWACFEGAK